MVVLDSLNADLDLARHEASTGSHVKEGCPHRASRQLEQAADFFNFRYNSRVGCGLALTALAPQARHHQPDLAISDVRGQNFL